MYAVQSCVHAHPPPFSALLTRCPPHSHDCHYYFHCYYYYHYYHYYYYCYCYYYYYCYYSYYYSNAY